VPGGVGGGRGRTTGQGSRGAQAQPLVPPSTSALEPASSGRDSYRRSGMHGLQGAGAGRSSTRPGGSTPAEASHTVCDGREEALRTRDGRRRAREVRCRCTVWALCAAAVAAAAAAQETESIYRGGTAKWYDSFDGRLNAEFPGDTFCKGRKLSGFGRETCEVVHGCCYIPPESSTYPETEQCVACQEIRGTWQGVLGTCVYKDIPTVVEFDKTTSQASDPVTTTRCIPTVVDPSLLVFNEKNGKMATGVSPSSASNNGGKFKFDFEYSRNEQAGEIDMLIATFLGSRLLFGKYRVEESELGSTLYLALGITRSPSAKPQQTSAVLPEELMYVFFEGFRIDEFTPSVETYAAHRLPAGSCKHVVTPGDDMDSISRRYMLTWQEIYAFNAHVYEPEDLRPGDILSVGRHHEVKGPCVNYQLRQNGPNADGDTTIDYTCTCTSKIECLGAEGFMKGETLFGISTRYGTSWQRIVDMNPKLFEGCDKDLCVITPGDHLCIVIHPCTIPTSHHPFLLDSGEGVSF